MIWSVKYKIKNKLKLWKKVKVYKWVMKVKAQLRTGIKRWFRCTAKDKQMEPATLNPKTQQYQLIWSSHITHMKYIIYFLTNNHSSKWDNDMEDIDHHVSASRSSAFILRLPHGVFNNMVSAVLICFVCFLLPNEFFNYIPSGLTQITFVV